MVRVQYSDKTYDYVSYGKAQNLALEGKIIWSNNYHIMQMVDAYQLCEAY